MHKVLISILILAVITTILMYCCCIAGGDADDKDEYIMNKEFNNKNKSE